MAFSVNTNITSLQAQDYLRMTSDFQAKTINKVTSGLRIVQSGDDAAGLAVANGFRSDQAVLSQGVRNANDGLSTLQTIDGGMSNISKLLDRARTLATQSASSTFTGDRAVLNSEFGSVVGEIDRQAQSIGLNTGGDFAKSLSVFVGGGRGADGAKVITNGSVSIDLTKSTVDSKSLGLKGVQAVSSTAYDLGASSTTSVSKIAGNANNVATLTNGNTAFYFAGPAFADSSKVKVSVNMSGVASTQDLVQRVNDAIAAAGNQGTAQSTAFKNAGIAASITTDATGKQQLAFTSSTTAFQAEAGDKMSNALMGNYLSAEEGAALQNTSTAGTAIAAATATASHSNGIIVRVQGGGLSSPVDLTLSTSSGTTTVQNLLDSLSSKVAASSALQAAGITMNNAVAGQSLQFANNKGEAVSFEVANDKDNLLGAGNFAAGSSVGSFDNTTVLAGTNFAAPAAAGNQTLEFSLQGGNKVALSVGLVTTDTAATTTIKINDAIANNATLSKTGIVASVSGSAIQLSSGAGGTSFRVNEVNTQGSASMGTFASHDFSSTNGQFKIAFTDRAGSVAATNLTLNGNDTTQALLITDINTALTTAGLNTRVQAVASGASGISFKLLNGPDGTVTLSAGAANDATATLSLTGTATGMASVFGFNKGVAAVDNTQSALTGSNVQTAGGVAQTDVQAFAGFKYGNQSQTLTFSANDSNGAAQSKSVVLDNTNATTIDGAIDAINTKLQATNNATLQKIVAVKEQSGGAEGIRFISTANSFSVGVGKGDNSQGIGSGAVQGTTVASTTDATKGSTASIADQSSAQGAVSALATAVKALGTSQAVVGRGQNQFNYAVNLAQSQLSNLAAAESRIRDADLASEAANMTKAQILLQAGVAALAQANSAPQQILSLLRG